MTGQEQMRMLSELMEEASSLEEQVNRAWDRL